MYMISQLKDENIKYKNTVKHSYRNCFNLQLQTCCIEIRALTLILFRIVSQLRLSYMFLMISLSC